MKRLALAALPLAVVAAGAALASGGAAEEPLLGGMDAVVRTAGEARAAITRGDGRAALPLLARVLRRSPDHPGLLLALARARALAGDRTGGLAALERAGELGFGLDAATGEPMDVPSDPAIGRLAGSPRFERALARIRQNRVAVAASRERVTLPERDLIPEGIAWDGASGRIFVGSLHRRKIVSVGADGRAADFVPEGSGGLWQVLGMKVDSRRGRLVVCSAADRTMRGYQEADRGRSGVFWFDLASGAPIAKALAPADGVTHLFNDLVLTQDGGAWVTDSEEGSLWRLSGSGRLERAFPAAAFLYPNGIALSPDGRYLYVASFSGVDRVEVEKSSAPASSPALRTRSRVPLPHPRAVTLAGIDGLSIAGGELIAVQNGLRPPRIAAFPLSSGYDRVVGVRVLDRFDPLVTDATTAAVAGDEILAIGNAQIGSFDADGKIFPDEKLEPVRIVSIPLATKRRAAAS